MFEESVLTSCVGSVHLKSKLHGALDDAILTLQHVACALIVRPRAESTSKARRRILHVLFQRRNPKWKARGAETGDQSAQTGE